MARTDICENEDSVLTMYLREIDRIPLLKHDEENLLAQKAACGDSLARERLVNANLRFVVSIAKQYQNRGLALEDLISEGNMGLLTAIEKYDVTKGYHFISYAVWWIRQAILKAIGDKSRMIRLPMNKSADLLKIQRTAQMLERKGEHADMAAIAKACSMEEAEVRELVAVSREMTSLDTPVGEDEDACMGDFIASDACKPEDMLMDSTMRESVMRAVSSLPERERNIITMRYGLDGNKPLSLKEVGDSFGLTKERIRQIEKKVLNGFANDANVNHLKAYIA